MSGENDTAAIPISGLKPANGYRCQIPECDGEGFQFADFSDAMFPRKKDGSLDYCSYYQPKVKYNLETGLATCSRTEFDWTRLVSCPGQATFVYNDFEFDETLATEWDSVCGVSPRDIFILSRILHFEIFRVLPWELSSWSTLLAYWLEALCTEIWRTGLDGSPRCYSPFSFAQHQSWLGPSTRTCSVFTPTPSPGYY